MDVIAKQVKILETSSIFTKDSSNSFFKEYYELCDMQLQRKFIVRHIVSNKLSISDATKK